MDKNEILEQLDTQLWPLDEISYTQNGQWFWYDFEPKQKDTEPLTIIWGGRETFKPATELKRQTAPYFCISYVLSGHGTLNIHGQTHKLEPGTLSGHCSGVPHHYSYDTQNPAEHIFVVFRGTEANELMQKSMIANLGALSASYSVDILRSMIDILKHSLNKTENSQRICSSHLRIILLNLADHVKQSSKHTSKAEMTFLQCRKFIDNNFSQLSSAKNLSDKCGWNQDYVSRLFKRFDGITPSQYLMRLKLSRAAVFLLETEATVTEIAKKLGFSDHYYFSKKFKSYHGISPSKYRKQHLEVLRQQ